MDILQATLAAGIRVVKYVPSYGDQPNDVQNVTKCGCASSLLGRSALMWLTIPVLLLRYCAYVMMGCTTDFKEKFRGYHVRISHLPRVLHPVQAPARGKSELTV